ncbi:MAG: hypothetical protein ACR2QA_05480 [Solirubrobacteraceae bacterium]
MSEQSAFVEDASSQERLRSHRHEAFVEVKWFKKGWRDGAFKLEGPKRIEEIKVDVAKLARHAERGRCVVAAMLVFDDESYFREHAGDIDWPENVWRLITGPDALRHRGWLADE